MKRVYNLNAGGLRVGESHQRAKLTDQEVDQIRELHEAGMSYKQLALIFGVGKSTIQDIITCKCRAQTVAGYRVVRLPDE